MRTRTRLAFVVLLGVAVGVLARGGVLLRELVEENRCLALLHSSRAMEWHTAACQLSALGSPRSPERLIDVIRDDASSCEPRFWRTGTASFLAGDEGPLPVSVRAGFALWRLGDLAQATVERAYALELGATEHSLRVRRVLRAVLDPAEPLFMSLASRGLPRAALLFDVDPAAVGA